MNPTPDTQNALKRVADHVHLLTGFSLFHMPAYEFIHRFTAIDLPPNEHTRSVEWVGAVEATVPTRCLQYGILTNAKGWNGFRRVTVYCLVIWHA